MEAAKDLSTLTILQNALTERERKKKQLHKVFKNSFDAKAIFSEKFLVQKLNYIHHNPVTGKWKLVRILFLMSIAVHRFMNKGLRKTICQNILEIYNWVFYLG